MIRTVSNSSARSAIILSTTGPHAVVVVIGRAVLPRTSTVVREAKDSQEASVLARSSGPEAADTWLSFPAPARRTVRAVLPHGDGSHHAWLEDRGPRFRPAARRRRRDRSRRARPLPPGRGHSRLRAHRRTADAASGVTALAFVDVAADVTGNSQGPLPESKRAVPLPIACPLPPGDRWTSSTKPTRPRRARRPRPPRCRRRCPAPRAARLSSPRWRPRRSPGRYGPPRAPSG